MKSHPTQASTGKDSSCLRSAGTLRSLVIALLALLAAAGYASAQVTGGTWTQVAVQFPGGDSDQALLLTDGTVMVQEDNSGNWWRLIPDQYGNYANGTWKATMPMPPGYVPYIYSAAVLIDGRVIVEGGEFLTSCANCGSIYDPVANSWTSVPPPSFGDTCGTNGTTWCAIGSGSGIVLPNGTFMLSDDAYVSNMSGNPTSRAEALLPPPYTGAWLQADPTGTKHDGNSEEGRNLLPNSLNPAGHPLVLTVDTYAFHTPTLVCNSLNSSELYDASTLTWYCLGATPQSLRHNTNEMGPAVLRPDGTVFQAGANQYTAILAAVTTVPPPTNPSPWSAGPNFPLDSNGIQLEIYDGPAALLPNGNVLMMASETETTPPATFLELTPAPQNQLVVVPGPPYANNLSSNEGQMLLLPTGQVLFIPHFGVSSYLEIYTPTNPDYNPSWAPVICGGTCSYNQPVQIGNNYTNHISGLQFNGMSQGAAFGDEYQSATNYPLIRITDYSGFQPMVYYCRTHDHTSMGVQTGSLLVSTFFDCPNVPTGTVGNLEVVANGIPSNPMLVEVVQYYNYCNVFGEIC